MNFCGNTKNSPVCGRNKAEPSKPPTYNPPSGGNPQEIVQSTRDALAAYYRNAGINGDADTEGFDGLDLMLVGICFSLLECID